LEYGNGERMLMPNDGIKGDLEKSLETALIRLQM
jgi:hypothetical protein